MRCAHCGDPIMEGHEGGWLHVDPVDPRRPDLCAIGDDWSATPSHRHGYRYDASIWWCFDCEAASDDCEQSQ